MSSKIVVVGDVNGRFNEVFGKLTSLHAKQQFSFAIIAGRLSQEDNEELEQLLSGSIHVPLPTYVIAGREPILPPSRSQIGLENGELCPNLSIISTSLKTSEGFTIASINANSTTEVDILVTEEWPTGIQTGAKARYAGSNPSSEGSLAVSELCNSLKPRYHFSTSEAYYEREPFFHDGPPYSITRFISLAPYGNIDKQKWIYAFSMEPLMSAPTILPAGCTASPLTVPRKRKQEQAQNDTSNFRYSNGDERSNHDRDYRHGHRKRQRQEVTRMPDECYFCLSNPKCETHMVGSIGNDLYLTIAKGPLTTPSTFPDLDFPGHMLLIPLHHAPTMAAIPEDDARQSTIAEMRRYQDALQKMLIQKAQGADGKSKLGAVTWEISRRNGVHLHWQWLPVPVDMVERGLVEAGFDVEAENLSYPPFVKTSKDMEKLENGSDFFKVTIWSEALRKDMVMPLDASFRFDLQFGRRVLGKLLGLEKRTHWKDCAQTKQEEERDATKFKEFFEEFDFSLEE